MPACSISLCCCSKTTIQAHKCGLIYFPEILTIYHTNARLHSRFKTCKSKFSSARQYLRKSGKRKCLHFFNLTLQTFLQQNWDCNVNVLLNYFFVSYRRWVALNGNKVVNDLMYGSLAKSATNELLRTQTGQACSCLQSE